MNPYGGIPGTVCRALRTGVDFTTDYSNGGDRTGKPTNSAEHADLVTSLGPEGAHYPVLDIDYPATLVPSTTPGHFHLYLDQAVPWWKYKIVLRALAFAGLIEPGYDRASRRRGFTAVRPPHVKKDPAVRYASSRF